MTFENAGRLKNNKAELWFKAGELSLTEDYDRPVPYKKLDDCRSLEKLVEENPEFILRRDAYKMTFSWDTTVVGKYPNRCLPLLVARDPEAHWRNLTNVGNRMPEAALKSYAPRKIVDELFGVAKDSESLEDSEIEELLSKTSREILHSDVTRDTNEPEMKHTYLVVTPNSVYQVGEALPIVIHGGLDDCQVFDPSARRLASLVLATTPAGYILNIVLNANDSGSVVTQYWDLGSEGPWFFVKHRANQQFVVINKREAKCKFFEFKSPLHFEAVNNLILDGAFVIDCAFFPSQNDSHFLLFVATTIAERLVYYCIEWDLETPKLKRLHYLTYLTGQKFKKCVPIGLNRVLIFYEDIAEVVSANQLMSGETAFDKYEFRPEGDICGYFSAPVLLKKLQFVQPEEFTKYEDCTVLGTTSGHINVCVIDNQNQLEIYSLTRFKGLKNICPVDTQRDRSTEYDMVVISYGRILNLSIDVTKIQLRTTKGLLVPSFSAISFKHTLDSSTVEGSDLIVLRPSKIVGRHLSELWLTSSAAVTHLQTTAPVQKIYSVCALQQFQLFSSFKAINFSKIAPSFRSRLLRDVEESSSCIYFVFGSDHLNVSRSFTLDLSTEDPQLTELSDLECDTENVSIDLFFTSDSMVQITRNTIYVESSVLGTEIKPKKFHPGWEIQGTAHYDDIVIIWNTRERQCWYINNINDMLINEEFQKSLLFEEEMGKMDELEIEFAIARTPDRGYIVYMAGVDVLARVAWNTLMSKDSKATDLDKVCLGRSNSMVPVGSWLCFIHNGNEVAAVNHSNHIIQYLDFDFGDKDIQLRKVDENSCLIFSTQEILIFSLSEMKNGQCWSYEFRMPHQRKLNPILDVEIDKINDRALVLYYYGLQVFEMSYFSWNRAQYLLRSTRDMNKTFLFIEKINRMLIVNFDSRKWDCIKLADGKLLSLDASVLSEPDYGEPSYVVEVSTSGKEVLLLLIFGQLVKLVHLIPQRRKITVAEVSRYTFSNILFPFIDVKKNGDMYLLQLCHREDSSNDVGTIFLARVNEAKLSIMSELKFCVSDVNQIIDFKLCGNDILINHACYHQIFIFKDFSKSVIGRKVNVSLLETPSKSKPRIIYPLNDDSFLAVLSLENNTDHVTELLFYHKYSLNAPSHDIEMTQSEDQNPIDFFEQVISLEDRNAGESQADSAALRQDTDERPRPDDQAAEDRQGSYQARGTNRDGNDEGSHHRVQISNERVSVEDYLEENDIMDEMDEHDAFERPVMMSNSPSGSANDHSSDCLDTSNILEYDKSNRPYQTIKLDKTVRNVKYDPVSQRLYVLATDGSVLVFRLNLELNKHSIDWHNSGYDIQ